jgi:excisionase family DNA binding protein
MSQAQTILQPSASELLKFIELATTKGLDVSFTISVKPPKTQLTTNEALELLNVSRSTLYDAEKKGIIKTIRIGGKNYFDRSHLMECRTNGLI